jgi:sugar/nucleoside kinase (ribokinase family)
MMRAPDYLLIGHISADVSEDGRHLGGTVAYAARTAQAFGLNVAAVTSVAADDSLLAELATTAQVVNQPAATTTFENIYTSDGRVQSVHSVAATLKPDHIPQLWQHTPFVHLAPLIDELDPRLLTLFPHSTVLLTLQGMLRRRDADGRVQFKPLDDLSGFAAVDVLVLSEEDITAAPYLERDLARIVPHVIVTRAAHGGTYYHAGTAFDYATPQVPEHHPTGAGDVFAAALLICWQKFGGDMRAALGVAARLGATSVTRPGMSGAPTPQEIETAFAKAAQLDSSDD